jgi:two-component system, OmpR family, response regulator
MKNNKIRIFLADDDPIYLKWLEIEFLMQPNFIVETFPTGEKCLENLSHNPDVVILDYHLDSMNKNAISGVETLDRIKAHNPEIPVVMLSSQDKIDVAINCMHHRAFDYVVKSETAFARLQKIIAYIFQYQKMRRELSWYMERN